MTRREDVSVAETGLEALPILGGYNQRFGDFHLQERDDLAIVSLAIPLGGEAKATAALKDAYCVELPTTLSSVSNHRKTRFIRTGQDQYFAIFGRASAFPEREVREALKDTVYTNDQSDVWVVLSLSGSSVRLALERICPIDLHNAAFPLGASARTVMEHMGALIIRDGDDSFLLMSASSSADSFLHAIETSIHNVT